MNIRKQGCWGRELTFVSWLSDGNWWSHYQEKVDCGGNACRKSHSLSQGLFKPILRLLLYEKGGHGSLSLYLSSRWVWEVYVLCCQPVLKCSAYPGKLSFDFGPLQSTLWIPPSSSAEGVAGIDTSFPRLISVFYKCSPRTSLQLLSNVSLDKPLVKCLRRLARIFWWQKLQNPLRDWEAAGNPALEQRRALWCLATVCRDFPWM